MKTEANEQLPEIEWNEDVIMDMDMDERMEVWQMVGIDKNGLHYSGTGTFFFGELDSIVDIQLEYEK